jgi:formylglycine-generating enzyme required for sulfatase activity
LSYLEEEDYGRDVPEGVGDRIVRGSSWLSREAESPETNFRSFDPLCKVYEDLGFRVACYERRRSQ